MTSLESVRAECDALRAELEEAKKQARLGWERAAEKDRAYGEALRERDEARAADAGRTRFCERCVAVTRERDELQANVDFLIQSNRADILVLLEIHRKQVAELKAERDEARRDLGEILAIIHRDGGHYTGEHGISKSVADAHATWAAVVREREEAQAELAFLRKEYGEAESGALTRDALELKLRVTEQQLDLAHKFHDVAVKERDLAWVQLARLEQERGGK